MSEGIFLGDGIRGQGTGLGNGDLGNGIGEQGFGSGDLGTGLEESPFPVPIPCSHSLLPFPAPIT